VDAITGATGGDVTAAAGSAVTAVIDAVITGQGAAEGAGHAEAAIIAAGEITAADRRHFK
jgi:hypothetical protein